MTPAPGGSGRSSPRRRRANAPRAEPTLRSEWDALGILVADRSDPLVSTLESVSVNGVPVGSFGAAGWKTLTVTGVDLAGALLSPGIVAEGEAVPAPSTAMARPSSSHHLLVRRIVSAPCSSGRPANRSNQDQQDDQQSGGAQDQRRDGSGERRCDEDLERLHQTEHADHDE